MFDFDDTLGNREEYAYDFFYGVVSENADGRDPWEIECAVQHCMIWDELSTGSKKEVQRKLAETYGIISDVDFEKVMGQQMAEHAVLVDGAREVLDQMKQRYRLALVTNGKSEGQHRKIEKTEIADYFDAVVVSGDEGVKKPDARLFEIAAERLNVKCSECIFVGDLFQTDMIGAHNAGMTPVWLWSRGYRKCSIDIDRISSIRELPSKIEEIEAREK